MKQLDLFSALTTIAAAVKEPAEQPDNAQPGQPPTHDYAGQLGDDGSLHYMLTGKPEPKP